MAWFLELKKDGVDLYPKFREDFEKPEYYINDKVRGETMRHFGYFMTESYRPPVGVPALVPQEPEGAGPVLRPARLRRRDGRVLQVLRHAGPQSTRKSTT